MFHQTILAKVNKIRNFPHELPLNYPTKLTYEAAYGRLVDTNLAVAELLAVAEKNNLNKL